MDQHPPNLPLDFVDLLAAFANAEVRYLVSGGYAVGEVMEQFEVSRDQVAAVLEFVAESLRSPTPANARAD